MILTVAMRKLTFDGQVSDIRARFEQRCRCISTVLFNLPP